MEDHNPQYSQIFVYILFGSVMIVMVMRFSKIYGPEGCTSHKERIFQFSVYQCPNPNFCMCIYLFVISNNVKQLSTPLHGQIAFRNLPHRLSRLGTNNDISAVDVNSRSHGTEQKIERKYPQLARQVGFVVLCWPGGPALSLSLSLSLV